MITYDNNHINLNITRVTCLKLLYCRTILGKNGYYNAVGTCNISKPKYIVTTYKQTHYNDNEVVIKCTDGIILVELFKDLHADIHINKCKEFTMDKALVKGICI